MSIGVYRASGFRGVPGLRAKKQLGGKMGAPSAGREPPQAEKAPRTNMFYPYNASDKHIFRCIHIYIYIRTYVMYV